ncbi:MAG: hypothetical protein ACU843_09360 [Gammaproteobacteria bacterium]
MRAIQPNDWIPVAGTVLGIAILITPLCGTLFACGCTWPFAGLAEHCNFFDPDEIHPCPFCEHLVFSIPVLSGGAWIAVRFSRSRISRKWLTQGSILIDSLSAILLFASLTTIAALLFNAFTAH